MIKYYKVNGATVQEFDIEEHDEQIKAAVIDEILNMAYCTYNGECMCLDGRPGCLKCYDFKINYKDVEELKEQTE